MAIGNVCLVQGEWNAAYLDELCIFPNGRFDDQVDASSGAFAQLTRVAHNFTPPTFLHVEPRSRCYTAHRSIVQRREQCAFDIDRPTACEANYLLSHSRSECVFDASCSPIGPNHAKKASQSVTTPYNPGAVRRRDDREFRTKSAKGGDATAVGQSRATDNDRESAAGGDAQTRCDVWR